MNSKMVNFLMFAVGAAIGSAVTWKLVKTKYERIANEEIESVKEVFARKEKERREVNPIEADDEFSEFDDVEADMTAYHDLLEDLKYNPIKEEKKEGGDAMIEKPYIIPPEEFDELDGYTVVSLTCFADKIVVDDYGVLVDDVDELVGLDSLNHFGEYEEDSVFVRNDARHTDYEILLDTRTYSEAMKDSTHQIETNDN